MNASIHQNAKQVVVLLHGFCEDKSIWESTIADLGAGYNIHAFDLPGFGAHTNPVNSIDAMADDVVQQMNEVGTKYASIVGHSMGGYVALNILKRYPEMVSALGLFHSNAAADSDDKKLNRQKSMEHLKQHGAVEFLKLMAESLLSAKNRLNKEMVSKVHVFIKDASVTALVPSLDAMKHRMDSLQILSETHIPVLWIAGRHDEFMSVQMLLGQASLCNRAMVHVLEDSGHLGMIEQPEQSNSILKTFLDWV